MTRWIVVGATESYDSICYHAKIGEVLVHTTLKLPFSGTERIPMDILSGGSRLFESKIQTSYVMMTIEL